MPNIIVLAGQTASGKSDLALNLAKKYNGIIVNSDSRQIFRDLEIGTAKPKPDKIKKDGTWYIDGVPHLLYGFASLETDYNVYKYQKDVEKVFKQYPGKNIFLVGGTGLYIDSIVHGFQLPKHSNENFSNNSVEKLQELAGEKINTLNESDRSNPRRLISLLKRESLSLGKSSVNHLYLILDIPKDILEEKINLRVEKMFEQGLEEENRKIYEKYPNYDLPSLNTIGYKEFKEYFEKKITLEQVKELVKVHTRQYAKKQMTWFKRNSEAIHVTNLSQAIQATSNFLKSL